MCMGRAAGASRGIEFAKFIMSQTSSSELMRCTRIVHHVFHFIAISLVLSCLVLVIHDACT